MGASITLSSKGQIAIPKDVRDRLGLRPGQKLRLTESGGAIVLHPAEDRQEIAFEDALARLRDLVRYDGPPVSIEDMNESINAAHCENSLRRDERSRH